MTGLRSPSRERLLPLQKLSRATSRGVDTQACGVVRLAKENRIMSMAFSHELARAQQQRSQAIGSIFANAGAALIEQAQKMFAAFQRARRARATYRALCRLDDWTLRDLGMDRSELESVAREAGAGVDFTRMRSVHVRSMIV